MLSCTRTLSPAVNRNKWVQELLILVAIAATAFLSHLHFVKGYFIVPGSWGDGDASNQFLPMHMFLGQNWQKGNYFWSWNLGLGGDFFSELSYYYTTSPIFIISYLLSSALGIDFSSPYSVIIVKTAMSMGRQALAMYFMYRLVVYEKPNARLAGFVSGAIYTLQPMAFRLASYFDFMTDICVYLPLVVLAYRRWRNEGKKGAFVLSLAVMIASNFYFAFMGCLFLVSLFIFDSFANRPFREGMREILSAARLSLLALMISAVAFVPAVLTLFESARQPTSASFKDMLPTFAFLSAQIWLLFPKVDYFAIPAVLLLLFFIRSNDESFRSKRRLLVFWLILSFLPLTGYLMNGFGYHTNRWIFILFFLFAYIFPDFVSVLGSWQPRTPLAFLMAAALLIWRLVDGFAAAKESSRYHVVWFVLIAVFSFVSLIAAYGVTCSQGAAASRLGPALLISSVFASSLILSTTHDTFLFGRVRDGSVNYQVEYVNKWNNESLKNTDNKDFFRVVNENINDYYLYNIPLLGYQRGTSSYHSMADGELTDYLKKDLNIRHERNMPSIYKGFDSRLFLETAWGVRYKMSSLAKAPAGYRDLEEAGSGVYVMNDPAGIDLWYDSFISESEWSALPVAEKDGLLLQVASLPDSLLSRVPNQIGSHPQPTDVAEEIPVDWGKVTTENLHIDTTAGVIDVPGDDTMQRPEKSETGQLIIPLEPRFAGEYLLHFDLTFDETTTELLPPDLFQLSVNRNRTLSRCSDYRYHYPMNSFTFRIPHTAPHLKIELTPGRYRMSNLRLTYSSYRHLETWTRERNRYDLENLSIDKNSITGEISNAEDGLLVLSVPYTKGWRAEVDGTPHDLIRTNGMFTGLYLEKGEHSLSLHYIPPGLFAGAVISVLGLLILVFSSIYRRRGVADNAAQVDVTEYHDES